jgi:hypothetical protein
MNKHSSRRRNAGRNGCQRNLTPIAILGGALFLMAAGLLFTMSQSTVSPPAVPVTVSGSPRLHVDQELIDFGDVPVGKMVKASFTLSNVGDQALTISHPPVPEVLEGC